MIHVFVGPSRPAASGLNEWSGMAFHDPASRGDLEALRLGCGDIVALIDGIVISGYSPSPRECASVLDTGARLWGCSSLGALRAVELRNVGMIGHGWVYERVMDRTITWDDELVAMLDQRSWSARTVFLANVRYGLAAHSRLSSDEVDSVIASLREIPVSARTDSAITTKLAAAGIDPPTIRIVLGAGSDIKKRDAGSMLSLLANSENAAVR